MTKEGADLMGMAKALGISRAALFETVTSNRPCFDAANICRENVDDLQAEVGDEGELFFQYYRFAISQKDAVSFALWILDNFSVEGKCGCPFTSSEEPATIKEDPLPTG